MINEPTAHTQERRTRDLFAVLRRRWALVLITVVTCLLLATGVSLIMEPFYGSTTLVELEGRTHDFATENPYDPLNQVSVPNPTDDLPTQVEVLMSLAVFEDAVQKAGVAKVKRWDDGTPMDPVVKARQVGQSNVIAVSVESTSQANATQVALNIPNAYRDYVQNKLSIQLDGAITFLRDDVKVKSKNLEDAQNELEKFRKASNLSSADFENQSRLNLISQAQGDVRLADQRLRSAQDYYNRMVAELKALPETIPNHSTQDSDQIRQQIKQKVYEYKGQWEAKRKVYTDESQETRQAKALYDAAVEELNNLPKNVDTSTMIRNPLIDTYKGKAAEARGQLDGAIAARASTEAALNSAKQELEKFNSVKGRYDQLSLGVVSATQLLEKARNTLQDLEIRQSKAKSPITTIAAPSAPLIVRPNWALNIGIGFLVGCAVAFALVRVREGSDDRMWNADSVSEASGLPGLSNISLGASKLPALITQDRSIQQTDHYRMLRSSLLNSGTGEPYRTVAITSAIADEGRTETAVNLAASMAMGGHQVVLIDANFRKPAIATMLNVPDSPGLAELLRKEANAKDVARSTNIEGLHVIPAGKIDVSSPDMLGSETFQQLLDGLRDRYHFVIVDTSPCLAGADGPVTASTCAATLFVVKLGTSRRSATRYCVDLLGRTRAHVLGVITNRPGANPKAEYREYIS